MVVVGHKTPVIHFCNSAVHFYAVVHYSILNFSLCVCVKCSKITNSIISVKLIILN